MGTSNRIHVYRYPGTYFKPWVVSFEGKREALDFATWQDAMNYATSLVDNKNNAGAQVTEESSPFGESQKVAWGFTMKRWN